jgi:glycosyltransferase involved in cell wall biosynthesis
MSLRILWASDAPWATSGYSNQTRLAAPRIAALGYDLALLTTYGLHGNSLEWQGLKVYPGGADPFANDVIKQSAMDWKADIVITLKDAFVFNPRAFEGLRWCPMIPVDHEPVPPGVVEVCRHVYRPIAYAPNGFRALRNVGFDPLYAPHGYDPQLFNPQPRAAARQFLGIPDDLFIVGSVAVNRGGIPSRKAWPQNLEAFAKFARDKPNARYFIHTYLCTDGFEGGINLPALCGQLGILDKMMFCDQERYRVGFPDEYLHAYYNAIDVLNAVSLGEGFGIPQLEAQACGTPVITSDWAAARDLCFAGWKVSDERGQRLRFYDGQAAWVFLPEPEAIAEQLDLAYQTLQNPSLRQALSDAAVKGTTPYQIDTVVTRFWQPLLDGLAWDIRNETSRGVLRIVQREEVFA